MMSSPASGSESAEARSGRAFDLLHPGVQRWIWDRGWSQLRPIQVDAISMILQGDQDVVVSAATAGGKTEAAWLPICSVLATRPPSRGVQALYVSPLKALINDQAQRLESLCAAVELPIHRRHGDVTEVERRALERAAGGVLLITPEALEAQFVRRGPHVAELFQSLSFVVVDEMHSFIGSPRGAQLQSLLHRVELAIRRRVPRIGLSATLSDLGVAREFLRPGEKSSTVRIVREERAGESELRMQLRGYQASPRASADASVDTVESSGVQAIAGHLHRVLRGQDNLVFANSRATVEQYADKLRELSEGARVPNEFFPHHGSLSKGLREDVEARLRDEAAPTTAICTSTLEMGIDIGSVDSIAQIGAPYSVAALRQRVGRSGRRGGAAILRLYIAEEALTADSTVTDRLRVELFQAIAVSDLMLEHWYEPPRSELLHLSTLVQQTLSVVAQHGGATAAQLYRALCVEGAFRAVTREQYVDVLRSLGAVDVLRQAPDNILLPGAVGDRIVDHYSFYAAFQPSDEYRLVADGRALGLINVDQPLVEGALLIFAGRRWAIVSVDPPARTIVVAAAGAGRVPTFGRAGGGIADGIRRRMREAYLRGEPPVYLDEGARALFHQGVSAFRAWRLEQDDIIDDDGARLVLWRGSRVCHTVSVILAVCGIRNSVEDMTIHCPSIGRDELLSVLARILTQPKPTAVRLASMATLARPDRYDEYLADSLLIDSSAIRDFDVEGAWDEIERIVADHPVAAVTDENPWPDDDPARPVVWGDTWFAVVDVETTGLSPAHGGRIIEIAIVTLDPGGDVSERWSTLIDPKVVRLGAQDVHGLSLDDLHGAPSFAEVIDEVTFRLAGKVVVAHNAAFDLRFLSHEFERTGARMPRWPALCTLDLSRRLLPGAPASLDALCASLGIRRDRAHAALDDALATGEILRRVMGDARVSGAVTPRDLGVEPDHHVAAWPQPVRSPTLKSRSDH
jgi:ATP-dependent helicase Lhr and Lhr-like helicase